MNIWFIRCSGETAHNQPGTDRCVKDEPPEWPKRKFNYKEKCLEDGFARYGFPGAGDLRNPGWRTRAHSVYGSMLEPQHERYLKQSPAINRGDLVLLPTYKGRHEVHLGVVVTPAKPERAGQRGKAYDYHDVPNWAGVPW